MLFSFLLLSGRPAPAEETPTLGDLDIVRRQVVDRMRAGSADPRRARAYADALRADGSWADIDYATQVRAGWPAQGHLTRLQLMARAWSSDGNELSGDEKLLAAIRRGLDYWLTTDPKSPNWWHNQIGCPAKLGGVLLMLGDAAGENALRVGLDRLARAKIGMTGQNRIWLTQNVLYRALLTDDKDLAEKYFETIFRTIRLGDEEGIQADASFFQHGPQLYTGGYGMAFAGDCSRWLALARGTRFAAEAEKVRLLSRYLLDGLQWMTRGIEMDPVTRGRGITRPGGYVADHLQAVCRDMLLLDPPRRKEFAAFARRLSQEQPGAEPTLAGNRHFWVADFMSHHRGGWYASVKMTSKRIIGNEAGNGEGRKNYFMLFGPSFVMRRGDEYRDLAPLWDWTLVPGITAPRRTQKVPYIRWGRGTRGLTSFVGGVSDGQIGLAAMKFRRGDVSYLKAWAMLDEMLVVLVADIRGGELPVRSSVNQCRLISKVTVAQAGGEPRVLEAGSRKLGNLRWLHHDGVGYLFPGGRDVHLANETRTGTWRSINDAGSGRPVRGEVFAAWVDHGVRPKGDSLFYAIRPGVEAGPMDEAAMDAQRRVFVPANTRSAQAVRIGGEDEGGVVVLAALYEGGVLSCGEGLSISADRPCLLLYRAEDSGRTVTVCDPTQKAGAVRVTVAQGDAAPQELTLALPEGPEAGKSVSETIGSTEH